MTDIPYNAKPPVIHCPICGGQMTGFPQTLSINTHPIDLGVGCIYNSSTEKNLEAVYRCYGCHMVMKSTWISTNPKFLCECAPTPAGENKPEQADLL